MTADDSSMLALLGLLGGLTILALYIWTAIALAAVFRKSGEKQWKAWVPFLNQFVLLELGGFSGWLVLLMLVPTFGQLAVWVLQILACHRINLGFGFGGGMTVLAALLFPVWASVIGLGSARWVGSAPGAAQGRYPGPAAPRFAPAEATAGFMPPPPAPRLMGGVPPGASPSSGSPPSGPPSVAPQQSRWVGPPPGGSATAPAQRGVIPAVAYPPTFPPKPPPPVPPVPPIPPIPEVADTTRDPVTPIPAWASDPDLEEVEVSAVAPAIIAPRAAPVAERDDDALGPDGTDEERAAVIAAAPAVTTSAPATTHETSERWAPPAPRTPVHTYSYDDTSEVSAVVGAPSAGSPRSALHAVSAQQIHPEPDDRDDGGDVEADLDLTVVKRRSRTPWSLVLPDGTLIDVAADVAILGRRPDADPSSPGAQLISIEDQTRTVSKTHARLTRRDDRWYITDLESTNGVLLTTLMGTEVEATSGVEVEVGDRFLLGDAELGLRRTDG